MYSLPHRLLLLTLFSLHFTTQNTQHYILSLIFNLENLVHRNHASEYSETAFYGIVSCFTIAILRRVVTTIVAVVVLSISM